jgi:hypothetical protein
VREDMSPEELVYMERMLKRRVSIEEAIARMALFDYRPNPNQQRRASDPIPPPQSDGPHALAIRKLAEGMLPGDELWEYGSSDESWEHLQGQMGFAIVRAGKVIDYDLHLMN